MKRILLVFNTHLQVYLFERFTYSDQEAYSTHSPNATSSQGWARPRLKARNWVPWVEPHSLSHCLLLHRVCVTSRLTGSGAEPYTQAGYSVTHDTVSQAATQPLAQSPHPYSTFQRFQYHSLGCIAKFHIFHIFHMLCRVEGKKEQEKGKERRK